jgi:hypothetical protein
MANLYAGRNHIVILRSGPVGMADTQGTDLWGFAQSDFTVCSWPISIDILPRSIDNLPPSRSIDRHSSAIDSRPPIPGWPTPISFPVNASCGDKPPFPSLFGKRLRIYTAVEKPSAEMLFGALAAKTGYRRLPSAVS